MIVNELQCFVCLNEGSGVLAGTGGVGLGGGGGRRSTTLLSPSLPHLPVLIATNLDRLRVALITVEEPAT